MSLDTLLLVYPVHRFFCISIILFRYLIEASTGIYTGSIFQDRSIARAGYFGEVVNFRDGSTIVQKTHHRSIYQSTYNNYNLQWRQKHVQSFGGRGVMVIRNPYRAVLSYWNYKTMKSHTKTNTADSLKSAKFQQFAKTGIQRWLEVITDWLEYSNELYCIFYEVCYSQKCCF